jgi:hypothetical protein
MRLLDDIEEAKKVGADALKAAGSLARRAEELDARAAALAKEIANAPAPVTYKVRLGEADHEISERQALAFACACFVALVSGEAVKVKDVAGDTIEVQRGDLFVFANQILEQAGA